MAHPLRERLRGFALVTEIMGRDWARGHLQLFPKVYFEIGFEVGDGGKLPGTGITYLGLMQDKRNLFEFQLGKAYAKISETEYQDYVRPFIERLQAYSHAQALFDRSFTDAIYRR